MNKLDIYRRSFLNALSKAFSESETDSAALDRAILYGVRYVVGETKPTTYEDLVGRFQLSELVMHLMTQVTPRRLSMIFPIDKDYEGDRYGIKDYFSTIEMIQDRGWDAQIGKTVDDVLDFLWDYQNLHTREFLVNYLSLASDLRRFQGQSGIAEELATQNGITVYKMYTSPDGKQYLVDENGRSKPLKQRPEHLKLVRGL